MARIEKLLLRTGIYQAPQGRFVASGERLRHLADQFARMKAAGIRVPLAWGHQPAAEPGDENDRAQKQFYLSKFNAGYLDDLTYNPDTGTLKFRSDIPGAEIDDRGNLVTDCTLPDGRKVKSAVGEVSAAVKDWRDGQGRLWKGALIHVALTPLPVVAGQEGFRELSTAADGGFAAWTLSLADFTADLSAKVDDEQESDMAEEPKKPDDEKKPDETPAPAPEIDTAPPKAAPEGYADVISGLQEMGVALPPHTTPENFFAHAAIAFHALRHAAERLEDDDEPDEPDEPQEPEPEPGGGQVIEEQRPVMMSLASETDPIRKKMLAQRQDEHKGRLLRRIDKLRKAGLMPAHIANQLRDQVDGYELSLTTELELVPKRVDEKLSVWEEAAAQLKGVRQAGKVLLGTVGTEAPRPKVSDDVSEQELEARAARVSAKR